MDKHIVVIKGEYAEIDMMNTIRIIGKKKLIDEMMFPVICSHCGKPYDAASVVVIHRFADCTLYTTPCCKIKADDRKWKSFPDYVELDKESLLLAK